MKRFRNSATKAWSRLPEKWRDETQRGEGETLEARWRNHVEAMRAMGREPKTFDEWLNS